MGGEAAALQAHAMMALSLDGSEPALLRRLARFPHDVEARHALGVLAARSGRYAWALQLLGQVARVTDSADLQDHLGAAYCGLSRFAEALRCFERAAAMKLDHAAARLHKAQLLAHLGRHTEAVWNYARAIALGLDGAAVHRLHGDALAAVGKNHEAVASFDRSLSKSCDSLSSAAAAFYEVSNFDAALAAAEWAVALRPDVPDAQRQRAAVLKALETSLQRCAGLKVAAPAAVSCILAALLGSDLAGTLAMIFEHASPPTAAEAGPHASAQRVDIDSIVVAHLFGQARALPATERLAVAPDLELTGTLASDDPHRGYAIIRAAGVSRVYAVGDSIGDATVREIYRKNIVVERGGGFEALILATRQVEPTTSPAS